MNSHELYGEITYNEWTPVYSHKINKSTKDHEFILQPNYEILFEDNKETPFKIRNKKTLKQISSCNESYTFCNNSCAKKYSIFHVALASAFPNIEPKETVDHINNDPKDNRISNLLWMERSKNSKKGQIKSVKKSNESGGRHGKYVIMRKPDRTDINNRDKSTPIGLFRNINKCSEFIIENIIQKDNKPLINTVSAKIRRAISTPHLKAYGYYYDSPEIKIDEEQWKPHPKYTEYQISTHGRFRNSYGIISQQVRSRNGSKYKSVSMNKKNNYIHKLVWETWVGEIPNNMDIMHDDTAPLCEDGSYRNWLCDLSIGSRSENMKSFHTNKIISNNIQKNEVLVENAPDLGLLTPIRSYPQNPLGDLMRNPPLGIQYYKPNNRGSKYVLGRRFSKQGNDISSTGKKNISDEEKFLEILKIYQENCIEDKQDTKIISIDINEYTKYLPNSE